jgi:hypothetical protein
MEEVYVLVYEWQINFDPSLNVEVYEDLEAAQQRMKAIANKNEKLWKENRGTNYDKDEDDMEITFYDRENSLANYESIVIFQREVY